MRVVQVPRRFVREEWGGTETVVLETSKRLLAEGHATSILCPNALATTNHETMDGIEVHRTPYFYPYVGLSAAARGQLDKKGGNLFSFHMVGALLRMPGLDLIHAHTQKRLGGIVRMVARRRGIPYVVSLHGGVHDVPQAEAATWTEPTRGAFEWGRALGMWVGSNRVLEDAAAIICVGAAEQRATQERLPHKRVITLPNGVDLDRFACGDGAAFRAARGIAADAELVLTVGRIDVQKNQLMVVRALPELLRARPRLHLLLIGHVTNPTYRAQLEAEASRLGVGGQLTIIPGLDPSDRSLADAFHAADVFLLPSVHEPFGIVVLEAWAAGRAVVASRVGGIPSFVEDGVDGLLFEPDDPATMARHLAAALDSPALAARLSAAGSAKARGRYSWTEVTRELIREYELAVAEHSRRR